MTYNWKYSPIANIRVPIVEWLPHYTKELFWKDLIAGSTVFVFLVPQGMAYAILAGLPPIYGLYSATIPLFIYAAFSTSRQLSIGPMAITSLILGSTCQGYGYADGSPEYIRICISISLLVGYISFFLGLFRLGALANIISHSVLVGFVTASALVIFISQLKYLLGFHVPRFDYTHQTIGYILEHLPDSNWPAVLIGTITFVLLYIVKEWKSKNKAPSAAYPPLLFKCMVVLVNLSNLLAIIFGSLIAKALIDQGVELRIVGEVPSGLKMPSLDIVPIDEFITLIPSAFALAFVAFANNWAIAVKYARINKYKIEATQELVASGLATMIGVPFHSFLVAGGLARTAVNAESGAMTQFSAIICGLLMLLALFVFTQFFYYIPMTVLGAIIEVSIIGMIDFHSMREAYKIDPRDCFVMVMTFIVTFFVGVVDGLFVGIFLSVALVMKSAAFPNIVHLGQLPDDEGGYFKDIDRFPEASQIPGFAIVRMDASPFFGNIGHFKEVILRASKGDFHSSSVPIHTVILDASAWVDIDLSGIEALRSVYHDLHESSNVSLAIACPKGVIRDILRHNGITGVTLTMSINDAIIGKCAIRSRRTLLSESPPVLQLESRSNEVTNVLHENQTLVSSSQKSSSRTVSVCKIPIHSEAAGSSGVDGKNCHNEMDAFL
jgi:SulP family sulfate permease